MRVRRAVEVIRVGTPLTRCPFWKARLLLLMLVLVLVLMLVQVQVRMLPTRR